MAATSLDLLQGTLDLLILRTLAWDPMHGYTVARTIKERSKNVFLIEEGALYPALHRLEQRGLVRGHVAEGLGLRRRRIFELTVRGRAEFRRWQTQPVLRNDVVRNLDALMLRFAFMDEFAGKGAALRFLKGLHRELAAYIPSLWKYLKSNREHMPQSGRLALESGIQGYEAQLRWTKAAMTAYGQSKGEK